MIGTLDSVGLHDLSCHLYAGRFALHVELKQMSKQALHRVNILPVQEQARLF